MFLDSEVSGVDEKRKSLEADFSELLSGLTLDYLQETKKHLSSLETELKNIKKFDAFGNEITPEGKDEEVWDYFAEKNLWENIFNKKYKVKQARYLDRLENFLSDTIENPERHIELFGRGLVWRYYVKSFKAKDGESSQKFTFEYLKTDDPLDPLSRTLKTFYHSLKG